MQEVESHPAGSVPHGKWPPVSDQGSSTRAIPAVVSPLRCFPVCSLGHPKAGITHPQIVNVRNNITTALRLSPLADSQPRWQPEVACASSLLQD